MLKIAYTLNALIICVSLCNLSACKHRESKPASLEAKRAFESIIPKPSSTIATGKTFFITKDTRVMVESSEAEVPGKHLAEKLRAVTGFDVEVNISHEHESSGNIYLSIVKNDSTFGKEGYELRVTEEQVMITASTSAGLFYGIQTLRQLLPAKIEYSTKQDGPWEIATGTIRDYPQYVWRGVMLDVARHFFSIADVKRYIDLISFYKMNVMHLHLSDDQGWRIEIKSWPNLTKHGGSTQVGGGKGGYYTQDQYRELVAYAQHNHVTIVPEIDLPGHTNAALASYGELNKDSKPKSLYKGTAVGFSTLRVEKAITFKFVDDVVRELASITPGPYIHIGGDEAASTKKEDYIIFINKFIDIVHAHHKRMIGWEDISQANIDNNVIAQHWSSQQNIQVASEKGARIIFSPSKKVYLDMQYDSTTKLGLHWAAYIEVDSSYRWDPATLIKGIDKEKILGVEAPLWTETIQTMDDIEYMAFPRLPGVAEIGWTPASERNWDHYKVRLADHGKRWKIMGIDFYQSPLVPWPKD